MPELRLTLTGLTSGTLILNIFDLLMV